MRNAELEAVILANPDDPAGYLVYADWLQTYGDLQGELAGLREDDRADFIATHAAHFLGPFAERKPLKFQLAWRHGFIRSATIGWKTFGKDRQQCEADFAAFLALDSARFVETLELGPVPGTDSTGFGGLVEAIEAARPPALRELHVGDTGDWDISSTSTYLPACDTIRGLRRLYMRGGSVSLGTEIDLPELRTFVVESGSLTADELDAIAAARWPQLEALTIWFGDPEYGASGEVANIARILAGEGLPELTHLGLMNCTFADEIARALVTSKILPQLRSLDLSMGNLSDDGMAAMLAAKDGFAHLDKLVVEDNALTNTHWPAARDLAKTVTFGTNHDLDRARGRYCSVGE